MPAPVEEPGAITPHTLYLRLAAALEEHTELVRSTVLFGNRTEPAPILARQFRLDPAGDANTGKYRDAPGRHVRIDERVVVHLTHEYFPHDADETYRIVAHDHVAAIEAVLTRAILVRDVRTLYRGSTRRQAGNHVETDLTFSLEYDLELPAVA